MIEAPRRVGDGPVTASTCLDLDLLVRWRWDTNGYYRALGIRPEATRREIREAYQRLNGQASPRLTYIVKQLLDPEIRRQYDATPLGSLFFDDEVEGWIRDARVQQSALLRAQGRVAEAEELEDTPIESVLDSGFVPEQDDTTQSSQMKWSWGFFLWGTECQDRERLRRWQELLVSELGRRGFRLGVAVGFSGDMASPWGVSRIGYRPVVFLNDGEQPTEALAQAAASRVVDHLHPAFNGHDQHGDRKMSANFRRGAEAAKEATKSSNFARTEFFNLEDGKSAILRFLTDADAWIVVDQHQMVPTKAKPSDYPDDRKWPEKMGAVCRKDPAFSYGECYICDFVVDGKKVRKPGARTWALACLREEVYEDGKVVGYKDKTREVTIPEKDGKPEETVIEKSIVVVNMGYKNFFSILEGFAGRYGTVLDRDYWIKRSGHDTDTTYQIVPNDPIETPDGRFDLREPKFMARYETDLDLGEIISERADDEFYARFFDPRVTATKEGKVEKTGASPEPQSAQDSGVDPARMEALASRVKGYGASSESTGEEKTPEPAAAGGGMRDFG